MKFFSMVLSILRYQYFDCELKVEGNVRDNITSWDNLTKPMAV
jgi:hypothetical protein